MLRQRPIVGRLVTVKLTPNTLGKPRVTVVASAKVSKLAVERNKLKRRCRTILRKLLPPKGVDLVVAMRVGSKGSTYAALMDDIKYCLYRAKK